VHYFLYLCGVFTGWLMNYGSITRGSIHQDTLLNQPDIDTAVRLSTVKDTQGVVTDTSALRRPSFAHRDSGVRTFYPQLQVIEKITDTIHAEKTVYNPYRKTFNSSGNFLITNSLSQIGHPSSGIYNRDSLSGNLTVSSVATSGNFPLNDRVNHSGNWLMLILMVVILLFIWIKVFYNKFFSILSNSLVSYQLSVKVFHEKNVLLKSVSFVLDVVYLIVLAFFLYECFTFWNLAPLKMTSYNLFLLLFNIIIVYTVTRSLILKLFSTLFKTESIIPEYVHNNFIINKGIGIVLFPVVFAVCYLPESFIRVLLWTGLLILGAGIIFKLIRGYQIIIRKDVLFIYLILYLCTLEILPLLLGYKVFMSLL
jgi:Domain of unknown function (DUF4271)